MATSGQTNWNATTDNIVTYAAKYLGVLAEGDELTPEEYNDCLWFLNAMIKQWIAKNDYAPGLKLWLRMRAAAFLSSTTGTYILGAAGGTGLSYWANSYLVGESAGANAVAATTINVASTTMDVTPQAASNASPTSVIAPNMKVGIQCDDGSLFWTTVATVPTSTTFTIATPLPVSSNNISNVIYAFTTVATPPEVIESVVLRDAQQNDTPVAMLTMEDWMNMPSKQAPQFTGDPIAIYYESHLVGNNGQGTGTLYTDVAGAQDTSKVLWVSYVTEIQDFVNPADEMYFPKEWAMALTRGLARAIHSMFNVDWTPQMEKEAIDAVRFARNANNKKTTVGFAPGIRAGTEHQLQWR